MANVVPRLLARPALLCALALAGCDEGAVADERAPRRLAADFRSEPLDALLEEAGVRARTRGFEPAEDVWRGFLVEQGSEVRAASLAAGTCAVVVAVGSSALRELDLRLHDSDGALVAHDGNAGSRAALVHCPEQTGSYYVAAEATAGSGLFAVRRYAGPTGLGLRPADLFPEPVAPGAQAP